MTTTTIAWNDSLRVQLAWLWTSRLRPRLEGLTDDEYCWEPVPGCWNVRPRDTSTAPVQAGSGEMTIDSAHAASAREALTQLDAEYADRTTGVASLGDDLLRPVGAAEPGFEEAPYAGPEPHVNREAIHRLAEVCLLRDRCLHAEGGVLRGA